MSTEIERTQTVNQNPPNPMEVIQGIAVLQAVTLGFLIASHINLGRQMRRIGIHQTVIFAADKAEKVLP